MYHFQVHTNDDRFKEELDRYAEKGFRSRSDYLVSTFITFAKTTENRKNEIEEIVWKYMQTEEMRSVFQTVCMKCFDTKNEKTDIFT